MGAFYVISGIAIAWWLSKKKTYCEPNAGPLWYFSVATAWPIALLNYWMHFREPSS